METSRLCLKAGASWIETLAAVSIVAGAGLTCLLSLIHGNAAACPGILLVFGMALTVVLDGRFERRLSLPIQKRRFLPGLACSAY